MDTISKEFEETLKDANDALKKYLTATKKLDDLVLEKTRKNLYLLEGRKARKLLLQDGFERGAVKEWGSFKRRLGKILAIFNEYPY